MAEHDELIIDNAGNMIAYLRESCKGPNSACRAGFRANRPYHLIPHHLDPRAQTHQLALTTYHYASRDEALEALETSWNMAVTVDNAIDRDAAYKRRVPVKILKQEFGGRY